MPSLRDIRRRIRSIKNTAQITKAMEMVAASRMRRAQGRVVASRPYSNTIRELVAELATQPRPAGAAPHPLLETRPVQRVGLILITPDRGLCGALPANIIRRAAEFLLDAPEPVQIVTVGRKGQDFMVRHRRPIAATFTGLGDRPSYLDVVPIARVAIDSYTNREVDAVYVVYPRFYSTLSQRPELVQLLPVVPSQRTERSLEYLYEPDPQSILAELLPRYVEVQVYQAVLETIASEHSARMVAMRNATDNANELVSTLTLTYNKARQAAITKEITEIATAAEAIGG